MTPDLWKSLTGGLLIGAGAAALILLNGQIAGISGILDRALRSTFGINAWRAALLLGLVAPAAVRGPGPIHFELGLPWLAVSGLLLSRMSDPQQVLGFLDVAGHWNPALALTMAGAIAVAAPAFLFVRRRGKDLLGRDTELPDRFKITAPLIRGSAIFGLGWGLSGICPGPGLLLLTSGSLNAFIFVGSMIAGIFAFRSYSLTKPPR